MQAKILMMMAIAALALGACGQRDENSEGNGPGNADGAGGREDPPATARPEPTKDEPASEQQPQQ
jgi:hypothetical protein